MSGQNFHDPSEMDQNKIAASTHIAYCQCNNETHEYSKHLNCAYTKRKIFFLFHIDWDNDWGE